MRRHVSLLSISVLAVALIACSTSDPAERTNESATDEDSTTERGTVDVSTVEQQLESLEGRLTGCIQSAAERGESPWGRIVVSFELTESGDVSRLEYPVNDAGEAAATCLERYLRAANLPAPSGGGVPFRRTYAFSAGGDFDTEGDGPDNTSSSASPKVFGDPVLLEPRYLVPLTVESPQAVDREDGSEPEGRPNLDIAAPVELAGPGELPKPAIESTFQLIAGTLRQCYTDALESTPGAEGEVVVRFTLQPDGSVTDADVSSGPFEADVGPCFVDTIRTTAFPPPNNGPVEVIKSLELTVQ